MDRQHIREHLRPYKPTPDRRGFSWILDAVANHPEAHVYFAELLVLGEYIHGPFHPGWNDPKPHESLNVTPDLWRLALRAYRKGYRGDRGIVAYILRLRDGR